MYGRLLCIAIVMLFITSKSVYSQIFQDVAAQKGIQVQFNSFERFGSGVSFYDFDQDGWDDLTFTMENDSIRFYKNSNGSFVQLPSFIYGAGRTKTVLWVDYDNDGHLDLFKTTYEGSYNLYRNNGNFQFTDVSVQAGFDMTFSNTYGAAFGDYNNDGYLDLYVCKYEFLGDTSLFHRKNQLYKNNGNGTFTNVTTQAGVENGIRLSFMPVWFDYNEDGWMDIYIINDRVPFENTLYRNNGDGTFTDVAPQTGTLLTSQDPMTNSMADFDHDGDLDIYMTNTGVPGKHAKLLVNNGNQTYTELGQTYGVDMNHWGWGAVWVDTDNDSWEDLYACTGDPLIIATQVGNNYYHNNQGQNFTLSNTQFSINPGIRSYSVAKGDLNNDGFYDLVVQNNQPANAYLWQNAGNANHYVKMTLQGTASNRMAIGSYIRVYSAGNCYMQLTHCGENYLSQNSQHVIIGLGTATQADSIVIKYPSGHTDTYYNIPADQHYYFTEGETYFAQIQPLGNTVFCEGGTVVLDGGSHTGYVWSNGDTDSQVQVSQSGYYSLVVQNQFGVFSQPDSVYIFVAEIPDFTPDYTQPGCFGLSDGAIMLEIDPNPQTAFEVMWNTGAEGVLLSGIPAGSYSYTYTDSAGCTFADSVELLEPEPLNVFWETVQATPSTPGSIELLINGGTSPYQVTLNDSVVSNPITGLAPGEYNITITDVNGCIYSTLITINGVGFSVQEYGANTLLLYPNPAKSNTLVCLQLDYDMHIFQNELTDILGKIYPIKEFNNSTDKAFIMIPDVLPGYYFLKTYTAQGVFTHKIFISR